ncbi:MAG: Fe-S-cluster-containing dehydrogenase component/CRP-like cAMP-binding protein [Gammaproteobacteria bacterium]|jgi:Fe-S-cluster-containing dehydrogenase component/CRP-like cAMP-binding protein
MQDGTMMERPQRWTTPFDPKMKDQDLRMLMARPELASVDSGRFPPSLAFADIIKNDSRIQRFKPGDIIIREGDYGNSAFLLLEGDAKVVIRPSLPSQVLGRSSIRKRSFFGALSQLWKNSSIAEARQYDKVDTNSTETITLGGRVSLFDSRDARSIFEGGQVPQGAVLQVPPLHERYTSAVLRPGAIFGEIAALARVPRTATIFAHTNATLLELRWQGLRDIRKYDEGWRRIIDESYRNNLLKEQLVENPIFAGLDEATLADVADRTLFETYGSFEWSQSYNRERGAGRGGGGETRVAAEGDYADGVMVIASGFARVSMKLGNGQRTLTSLREGDIFGLDELYSSWKLGHEMPLETSLSALGYLHVLRVPFQVMVEHIFPKMEAPTKRLRDAESRPLAADSLLEWAVDERFINGTKAMLIDLNKCVRCDDCVRACASTHGGNPRFLRHGKVHGNFMVANSCMHCVDPVCMIGCPTGAIHRTVVGSVVINDTTCIGCGTCAGSCPYDNIRLVEVRNTKGQALVDPVSQSPIMKATKCDLCSTQPGGPACVRACPHDALSRVDFREGLEQWQALN